ncbi:MAG: ornithine cyclodeaminase family protein [Alphaproteobacteria bacterium]|nr:ornithine cyclodeaminase family protein [Alphaproteobacteria bacterium]
MTLRIVGAQDVRALLTMERAIALMREAMAMVARNETVQPLRSALWLPDRRGLLGLMPGYVAKPERLGVKVLTVMRSNFAKGLPSHQGMVMLFDTKDGKPEAIIDAQTVTAIRTAAATAVATDVLARSDAKTLAFFGYGEQAETHLEALRHVRAFECLLLWGRDTAKAAAFARQHTSKVLPIEVTATAEDAAARADVICTLTAAIDPIVFGRWLKPGTHVNAVGSGTAREAELDIEAIKRSRMFADNREGVLGQCGEFLRAKGAGAVDDAHVLGSIGDVIVGNVPGRKSAEDITLFKSLGMAVEDIVSCEFVLAEATRRDIGHAVEWG